MVERCYWFNPRQFRLQMGRSYDIMRKGRKGVMQTLRAEKNIIV